MWKYYNAEITRLLRIFYPYLSFDYSKPRGEHYRLPDDVSEEVLKAFEKYEKLTENNEFILIR